MPTSHKILFLGWKLLLNNIRFLDSGYNTMDEIQWRESQVDPMVPRTPSCD